MKQITKNQKTIIAVGIFISISLAAVLLHFSGIEPMWQANRKNSEILKEAGGTLIRHEEEKNCIDKQIPSWLPGPPSYRCEAQSTNFYEVRLNQKDQFNKAVTKLQSQGWKPGKDALSPKRVVTDAFVPIDQFDSGLGYESLYLLKKADSIYIVVERDRSEPDKVFITVKVSKTFIEF